MRTITFLLFIMLSVPTAVMAHPAAHHPPSQCNPAPHPLPGAPHPPLQCVAGTVTAVFNNAMKLQPVHGHSVKITFVARTVFQTDSGPGTLEGIIAGDFACVTTVAHGRALVAQRVVFDLTPFPCLPKKKPHHPPATQ